MTQLLRRSIAAAATLSCLVIISACGSDSDNAGTTSAAASSSAPASSGAAGSGTLTVFAAASLKNTFTAIGMDFEAAHPGTSVAFNFAGSSDLVTQITSGAPADVFASADENNMKKATDAGVLEGSPVPFAGNTLTIVTQPGNPEGVEGLADLARSGLQVVVCAPQVPCGSATEKLEEKTGVTLSPVSEESSVTDVLNKVQTGQADAGLVYVTDAIAAGDKVTAVGFPESDDVVNVYPIAALKGAGQAELAASFIELVTGAEGQQVLKVAGFLPAP